MPLVTDFVVPYPENLPLTKQGVPVPGTKRPGQTAHYQNGVWGFNDSNSPGVIKTMDQVFQTGLKHGKDQRFLGRRPQISSKPLKFANYYEWQSYGQVDARRRSIGSAMEHLFKDGTLGGGEYETVGIWSANRPEWQILDIACASYAKVCVSLYDTLGTESVEYIINHSHLSIVFTTVDHVSTLIKLAPKAPSLKIIVSIDDLAPESNQIFSDWSQTQGIQLYDLRAFEAFGQNFLREPIPAKPEDLASICYTSGTTGNPKGVILTHKNLALAVTANLWGFPVSEYDDATLLSYLPLAHIYGRLAELCMIAVGARIGYWTGDPIRLLEDAQILRPHFFPSVPRVLNRVYQAAMVAAKVPGMKGALLRKAIEVKLHNLHTTGSNVHLFWDKLVFRKISAVLGGNLVLVTCGSAPINLDVIDFLKIAFSCSVVEGWGMTETCASGLRNLPGDRSASGNCGPPSPFNEIKLIDVPSMGYTSEDKPNSRGELLCRGDICFSVYFKDEKNTKETVDEEGWIHTGDVAEVDAYGRFKIIDRVKNIMKLAQGEYVALEKIENAYATCPLVAQVFVYGDSLQAFLLGVVVPDPAQLAPIASRVLGKRITAEDVETLSKACHDEQVKKQVLKVLTDEAKKSGLKGFERIKRIHLSLSSFSIEDNTLTPTLKLRRKDAYKKFKTELDAMYAEGDQDLSKL